MASSERQFEVLDITERVSSTLSLIGTSFIILTFLTSRAFHKPINRLAFYAAFANILANVATLITRAGIRAGRDSALCQMQGFFIQWFMVADPMFTLAMALNVYLTFFRRYSAEQLKSMDWKYLVCCYGAPFVPALTYLFLRDHAGVRVYGAATLWCWVSHEWDFLRIATFYAPVWVSIVITMAIYIYVGVGIFRKRSQLRNFGSDHSNAVQSIVSTKTTEVRVTRELNTWRNSASQSSVIKGEDVDVEARPVVACKPGGYRQYSVTINSGKGPTVGVTTLSSSHGHALPRTRETTDVAWSYTRAAVAYFVAMLVTWVPSSIYRVYGLVYPNRNPYPFVLLTSLVLPLQGFWNAIIYIIVSHAAVQTYFRQILNARPFSRSSSSQ